MPDKEENLNNEESSGYSIHDVSQRLSIPENTLRKYLAYFDLEVERIGRKNYLSEQVIQCLSEILQLKSNSWSLKQIKAFRDAQKNKLAQTEKENKTEEIKSTISEETQNKTEEIPENNLLQKPQSEQEAPKTINLPEQEIIKTEIPEKQVKKEIQIKKEKIEIENSHKPIIQPPAPIESKANLQEKINNDFKTIKPKSESENTNEIETSESESSNLSSKPSDLTYLEESSDDDITNLDRSAGLVDDLDGAATEEDLEQKKNKRIITIFNKPPLTKDYVNKEIATQAKRASRLYRFLGGSRNSAKDSAEIKTDLNRRVEFLNGLRYIRDNWLERQPHKEKDLSGVN